MPLKAAKVTAQLNGGDLSLDVPVAQITGVGRQIHVLVRPVVGVLKSEQSDD